MGWLEALIGGAFDTINAGVNYGYTKKLNEQNAELQHKYWNIQNDKTFAQNEQAADNADARTRALYDDLQSPQAIKKQLLDAGLNPALMYSQGGMGGQVQSGAQGAGGGSPTGVSTLGLQNISQLDPLKWAQIENIEADTKNKEEDAKNKNQDTAVKKAQEEYIKADTNLKNLETQITENNLIVSNATIQEQINNVKTSYELAIEELRELRLKNNIDEETFDTRVKTIEQNYFNIVAQGKIMELEQDKIKATIENTQWDTKKKQEEIQKIKEECKWIKTKLIETRNNINLLYYQTESEAERKKLLQAESFKIYEELQQRYGGWNKEDFFRVAETIFGEGIIPTIIDIKKIKPTKS